MNWTKAALILVALLASGCGSSKPDPMRDIDPALPMASQPPQDKGQGHITFRYSNKTTDASLAIDLGSTDVYLEMSGKAAQEQAEAMREAQAAPAPRKQTARPPQGESEPAPDQETDDAKGDKPQALAGLQPDLKKAKAQAKTAPEKKPEPPPEEEDPPYEDVTAKVLSGIRRAQELFYQKRYPEALMAVRSSLEARPTAEGHALAGSIHFMQGQGGMARRQWMEALRLNPDMPAVVNMLEKTRTPGGRGSPSPRPVYRPALPAAPLDAPYPEEYSSPAPTAPASSAAAPLAEEATAVPAPAVAPLAGRPVSPAAPAPAEPVELQAAPEAPVAPAAPVPAVAAPATPAKPAVEASKTAAASSPGTATAAKPAAAPAAKAPPALDTSKAQPAKPKVDAKAAKEEKKK